MFPILTQIKILHRKNSRHQLENGERHAALVDVLKNLTDGFLRRVFLQGDDGNFILECRHHDAALKVTVLFGDVRLMSIVC